MNNFALTWFIRLTFYAVNSKVNVEPTPVSEVTDIFPDSACAILWEILSPKPLLFVFITLLRLSVVLKYGLNRFLMSYSLIPSP